MIVDCLIEDHHFNFRELYPAPLKLRCVYPQHTMGVLTHHKVIGVVFTINLRSAIKKPYVIHLSFLNMDTSLPIKLN